MKLEMLAKDESSGDQGSPSCYLGDDVRVYVQADEASTEVYAAAQNLLPGERIVGIDPQVIPGLPSFPRTTSGCSMTSSCSPCTTTPTGHGWGSNISPTASL